MDPASIPKYQYQPLERPQSIRVLKRITYKSESPAFEFEMHVIDLEEHPRRPYYALSYTWKLPEIQDEALALRPSPVTIRCDDQIIEIGENLFDCLVHVETFEDDPEGESLVWIDAICINQTDLEERRDQVAMMQKIYTEAEGVFVWLGREDMHSRIAIPLISKLAVADDSAIREVQNTDIMIVPRELKDPEFYSQNEIEPLTTSDWNSIQHFFSRSWFHRLWTVQELVMGRAKSDVVMLCGYTPLHWEELSQFLLLVHTRGWESMLRTMEYITTFTNPPGSVFGIDAALAMGAIYDAKWVPNSPQSITSLLKHVFACHDETSFVLAKFAWLIQLARQKQASDQRDRIFASIGLTSKYSKSAEWDLLSPNYSKSVTEVFTDASSFIIQVLGNLSWLSFVQDRSLRTQPALPSWVPDLSVMSSPVPLVLCGKYDVFENQNGTFKTDSLAPPSILSHAGSLSLRGFKLDVVASVSIDINRLLARQHCISSLLVLASKVLVYHTGDSWLEAFMKTLITSTPNGAFLEDDVTPTQTLDDLLPPFLLYLKLEIAFEICDSKNPAETRNWWDRHADFEQLCAQDSLLPSRAEFEDYFATFCALYPADQEGQGKLLIESADFMEVLWNPTLPYRTRTGAWTGRGFLLSRKGFMGLAPVSATLEDEIWMLEGAKIPFVLRRRPEDDGYELIGETYVHGFMQGEFFAQTERPVRRDVVLR